ncbi:H-NS family nucleoid-associated regulatory protein [Variovorax sp. J2P1-59]|uniref:H-NS family nucleoid-associated regulatory protein n=1 Tax=Variovorax flavidus TaxID=3053501 RepID=UPI0025759024|nr:H-NS family nucleoid-associated regulatory protein [Variovorax sp. J2P1-59]MDM0073412.1 H-NS family nucleoid-associated regulatory protein [Variovorax sp. J2P1-59]
MTQTYSQLQKKIAMLQRQADALRDKEISGVISRIKVAIDHYGLTAHQLGFGAAPAAARKPSTADAASAKGAKYIDGNGNSWSGRGPRPHWLRDALASGRSLDEFVSGASAAPAAKAKTRKFKRRPSSVLYRDGSGNSWTGRGPQPRWMKEALASGKTLEDLKG